ncbi:MAG: hypothetical protein NZ519_00685 [Bacteroidia bacterium]|nr:hypothetical protein [Bacteroidia bacterium]MDW8303108.1 hypothetical protein [Bacteroidia bacterium]
MVVWMSISVLVFLYLDKGYAKNSYLMYIALIIASLMYQWAFKQHQKWKQSKQNDKIKS